MVALHGGYDAVTPERGRIPGNAGVGIRTLNGIGDEHVKIGDGPAENFISVVLDVSTLATFCIDRLCS